MVWADNCRILAILAVVFLHVAGPGVQTTDDLSSGQWWIANIYDSLVRWCVPVFVMLSGALLLSRGKTESIFVFYKKRAARLLPPIVFWSFFYTAVSFVGGMVTGNAPSLLTLGKRLVLPHGHMWFLYMIAGLYLVAPFLRTLLRNTAKREILFLVILLFVLSAINTAYQRLSGQADTLFTNWFLTFLPYFILGHLISESTLEPRRIILLLVVVLSALLTALGCFLVARSYGLKLGLYFYAYVSVTVIPMSISMMFLMRRLTAPMTRVSVTRRLSGLVLGIYLVHPLVLRLLRCGGIIATRYNALISIPLVSFAAFVASATIAWCIHAIPYLRRTI